MRGRVWRLNHLEDALFFYSDVHFASGKMYIDGLNKHDDKVRHKGIFPQSASWMAPWLSVG